MPGFFDELHQLEQAIRLALDKVPKELRPHSKQEIAKHLQGVRLEFAKYIKTLKEETAKKKPSRKP